MCAWFSLGLAVDQVEDVCIFGTLFENNKPSQVLKFMSEETSFPEELRIMSTMQIFPFFRAMLSTMRPA